LLLAAENVSFAGKWDVPIFPICSNFCTNCIFRNHSYTLSNIFSYSLQIGLRVQLGRSPFSGKSFIEFFISKKIFFFAFYIIVGWFEYHFLSCGFYPTFSVNSETNIKVIYWNSPSAFVLQQLHVLHCSGFRSGESVNWPPGSGSVILNFREKVIFVR
jgi:hypothetical protein